MNIFELILTSVGLSMDAFAVAICLGLTLPKADVKNSLKVGLYFGLFQAGMPVIGFFAATFFEKVISDYAHWIAFGVLAILGGRMIVGSFKKDEVPDCSEHKQHSTLDFKTMFPLAVATSIDAMAVGVTFAALKVSIVFAVTAIGVTTLAISAAGVKIGNVFGSKFKSKAEAAGGVILILIGVKILIL
ncbi:MAG: manganese efflux pump MntP family protein [Oscillospiraceae bacterium]|nr:manganese efflux pump MntP family protein [Oscillospiraceae bacterium]